MSDQNKDSLENFFRERAQHHNLEFNEEDWLKLEAQLDKEMPVTFSFLSFLKKFWFIPLLVFLIPAAWITYTQFSGKDKTIDNNEHTYMPGLSHESGEYQNHAMIEEDKIEEYTSAEQSSLDAESQKKEYVQDNPSGSLRQHQVQKNAGNDKTIKAEAGFVGNEKSREPISYNIGYAVSENGAESFGHTKDSKLHFLFSIPPAAKINDQKKPGISESEKPTELIHVKQKVLSFYAGIGYSPDFSTVGLGDFIAPGSRWTAIIEMGIKNRFMVNTGFVWVNNKYEVYGEDYHAPYRYWQNGIVADEAYGECVMIDVPLNLRYNFWIKNKHQLFVSAGASAYFLLKEDYWFYYEQDDPDLPHYWGTDSMSVYPFGIINLSFGYQYALGRKGMLQVEPFIKIPTTGVGWGNVDLHTVGAYFIYKYRIGK